MDKECVRVTVSRLLKRVNSSPRRPGNLRRQSRKPDRQLRLESFWAITGTGSGFQIKHVKTPLAHLLCFSLDGPVKLCAQVKHNEHYE